MIDELQANVLGKEKEAERHINAEEDELKHFCIDDSIESRLRNPIYVQPHLSASLHQEVKALLEDSPDTVTLLIKLADKWLESKGRPIALSYEGPLRKSHIGVQYSPRLVGQP